VEQLSGEMKGVKFGKLNVDEQPAISERFEVSSIPTLLLFKDGSVVANRVGATTKEALRQWIDSAMKGE
jgi:thioredoxin-like negative regulator of GroEL